MENEKDNFWVWIGALIVAVVILVFMLKSREMESAGFSSGYAETKAQIDKQIANQKK
ncbi:MAG: hypothetical protein RIQ52_1870 [Pseudomonadota bacterium]|jgi:hypothetical protein